MLLAIIFFATVMFTFIYANHFPFIKRGIINLTNVTVIYLDVCPYFTCLLLSTIEEPFTIYDIIVTGSYHSNGLARALFCDEFVI